MARYAIFKGSQSAHCCFCATVVDTTKPDIDAGEHHQGIDLNFQYEAVCECFSVEDAELVCKALNALDAQQQANKN
jgi:plastocyanin domain-containing protein